MCFDLFGNVLLLNAPAALQSLVLSFKSTFAVCDLSTAAVDEGIQVNSSLLWFGGGNFQTVTLEQSALLASLLQVWTDLFYCSVDYFV